MCSFVVDFSQAFASIFCWVRVLKLIVLKRICFRSGITNAGILLPRYALLIEDESRDSHWSNQKKSGTSLLRFSNYYRPAYFFLGPISMIIFLPSRVGNCSALPHSSNSVAKRNNRTSPCTLNTISRPRKNT